MRGCRFLLVPLLLAACDGGGVSEVDRLRDDLGNRDRVAEAAYALGALGPRAAAAVPDLIEALWRRDGGGHREICMALGDIGARPDLAVPALTKVLHHESMELAGITALARFGKDAAAALPALEKREAHPDPTTRAAVAEARWRITGDVSHVANQLRDGSEAVRFSAVWTLAEAGERAILRRASNDKNLATDVRDEAREALAE